MNGVEAFVEQNFGYENHTFNECLELISYAYNELIKSKRSFSRKQLESDTLKIKGKAKNIELEDHLRNILVNDYIEPNREQFDLKNFKFFCGVDELYNNIRTGILDVKVCSSDLTENIYYIFECKRLNKKIIYQYLEEGVLRFTEEYKYYPEVNTSLSGMIAFLESNTIKNKLNLNDAKALVEKQLNDKSDKICLIQNLTKYACNNTHVKSIDFIFQSEHKRKEKSNITIYHIFLDYNDLVVD